MVGVGVSTCCCDTEGVSVATARDASWTDPTWSRGMARKLNNVAW